MKSLIVYPEYGLANRLRVLASANILAEYTGRKLFVNWIPSKVCNVEWQYLFLNQLESCPIPLSGFQVGINLFDDSVIPMSLSLDIPRLSVSDEPHQIVVHTCRNFQPEEMTNEAYADAKSSFYKNLRPVEAVQKTIDDMQKRYFDGCDVIGVHIRRNDHLTFLQKDHRLVCPTSMFVEAMENILRVNPGTKFFLATDDKKEEMRIRRLFPDIVIVYAKESVSRNTKEGMQDALVDWMLLSKTSSILAPYMSSFSVEAGAVNRIKTRVIVAEDALSKPHLRILFPKYLEGHYKVLKEEGIKAYLLRSYNYRKGQMFSLIRKKTSDRDEGH